MTKQILAMIAAAVLALPVAAQTAVDAADATMIKVQDFAVFVDPPTGFVFVKMPMGWKFVGKVDHATVASLPTGVITSLLPAGDSDSIDVAGRAPAGSVRNPG